MEGSGVLKIKLDEHLSGYMKAALEQEGHDTATVADEGLLGKNDAEVGGAAGREGRMLLTLDLEFADLRKHPPGSHPGVGATRATALAPR